MKILDPQKLSSVNGGVGFIACCAGIGAALTVMHFLTRRRVQSSFDDAITLNNQLQSDVLGHQVSHSTFLAVNDVYRGVMAANVMVTQQMLGVSQQVDNLSRQVANLAQSMNNANSPGYNQN